MKHEYVINHWFGGRGEGTTCLFRSSSEKAWLNKIKEICAQYHVQGKYAKTVVWEYATIFSFATGGGVGLWAETTLLKKPIQVLYGLPKEVKQE